MNFCYRNSRKIVETWHYSIILVFEIIEKYCSVELEIMVGFFLNNGKSCWTWHDAFLFLKLGENVKVLKLTSWIVVEITGKCWSVELDYMYFFVEIIGKLLKGWKWPDAFSCLNNREKYWSVKLDYTVKCNNHWILHHAMWWIYMYLTFV